MKNENISIIIVSMNKDYNLELIMDSLNNQKYNGKLEIIIVDKKQGLASNMNYGLKKAKNNIVITLHGDCIPSNEFWVRDLVEPFKDKKVIATVSDIEMPEDFWKSMNIFTKSLFPKEKGLHRPLLDEKGCAYRKESLEEVDYFNEELFNSAGEDFDIYTKLSRIGKISYPGTTVIHRDFLTLKRGLKKIYRNAEGFGTLYRVHGIYLKTWYLGGLKAQPVLGLILTILSYPFTKGLKYYLFYIMISPVEHVLYSVGFWKGFFKGKQEANII